MYVYLLCISVCVRAWRSSRECWFVLIDCVTEGASYIVGVRGARVRYHEAAAAGPLPRQPRQQKVGPAPHRPPPASALPRAVYAY